MSERVFLGLGANIGNRRENLRAAVQMLARECEIVAASSLYESDAVVLEGQPAGPDFYNSVVEVRTKLEPPELLRFVKQIEHEIGRRPAERWAPRPIDIDILLYGDQIIETAELAVPHPAIAERPFVLAPLAEIAREVTVPGSDKTLSELLEHIEITGLRYLEPASWVN